MYLFSFCACRRRFYFCQYRLLNRLNTHIDWRYSVRSLKEDKYDLDNCWDNYSYVVIRFQL